MPKSSTFLAALVGVAFWNFLYALNVTGDFIGALGHTTTAAATLAGLWLLLWLEKGDPQ